MGTEGDGGIAFEDLERDVGAVQRLGEEEGGEASARDKDGFPCALGHGESLGEGREVSRHTKGGARQSWVEVEAEAEIGWALWDGGYACVMVATPPIWCTNYGFNLFATNTADNLNM